MARLHEIMGYEVLATLGYGARSTICAVKGKDHQVYALKRVVKETSKDQRFVDQAVREHELASKLDHPSVRRSFKLIRQRKLIRTVEVIVLLEMVDGLTLEQHKPAGYEEFCRLFQQVASGLDAMHQAGYVHADVKPNNIMVTDRDGVKLIDLGQSCAIGTVKQRIQGTPDYIAPEQVRRRKLTPQTDVFNLGATMYWLLTDQHVPTLIPKRRKELRNKDDGLQTPTEINPEVPLALTTLVMDCVKHKPGDRPESMAEVRERLGLAIGQLERRGAPGTPVGRAGK